MPGNKRLMKQTTMFLEKYLSERFLLKQLKNVHVAKHT